MKSLQEQEVYYYYTHWYCIYSVWYKILLHWNLRICNGSICLCIHTSMYLINNSTDICCSDVHRSLVVVKCWSIDWWGSVNRRGGLLLSWCRYVRQKMWLEETGKAVYIVRALSSLCSLMLLLYFCWFHACLSLLIHDTYLRPSNLIIIRKF